MLVGLLLKMNGRDWGDKMRRQNLRLDQNEGLSLQRPAYTQYDLYAYRHRHIGGKTGIVKDFFVKSKGRVRK